MIKIPFLLGALLIYSYCYSQQKIKLSINSNWSFHKGKLSEHDINDDKIIWSEINIPHSWNANDVMDDTYGYYRGDCWYKKDIFINNSWEKKDVSIFFEGANQIAEIFINGVKVGEHRGGYTAFCFNISSFLNYDKANRIYVKVNNAHNEDIPPLSADFTFFGGIYRDVFLIATNKIHFDTDNLASDGVMVSTPEVSEKFASVKISGLLTNGTAATKRVKVLTKLLDMNGKSVKEISMTYSLLPNAKKQFTQEITKIENPELWSPEHPYLYKIVSVIFDKDGDEQLDLFSSALGFRWFSFRADSGFFLNGKPTKLVGASRHQDFANMANALPDQLADRDVELIKKMGGNFVRVAHYPQDPTVLQACDRLGLLAMVETPEVNQITETLAFTDNSLMMQKEMIRQNFNHPCVIIWGYMNEVLIRQRYESGSPERKKYLQNVLKLAQQMDSLTRKEDPSRYTLLPCHGNFDLYNNVGLTNVPMILGWNLYFGWYNGKFNDLEGFLRNHHDKLPAKPLIITEYGADEDNRLRAETPVMFDKTIDYALLYHKHYLNTIEKLPYVAGAAIWNLVDFSSETRSENWPHLNTKGLLTWDRIAKDTYYFYQASLSKTPTIIIGSKNWKERTAVLKFDSDTVLNQNLEIFSNQPSVTLYINGKSLGSKRVKNSRVTFSVPYNSGINLLEAVSDSHPAVKDFAELNYNFLSPNLKSELHPFKRLNMLLGSQRQFTDELLHQSWIPEREYHKGSWGYVGGKPYIIGDGAQIPYGTSKLIKGTDNDPIYQTQRQDIEELIFNVPIGQYEVTLHFAEFFSGKPNEVLSYNLSTRSIKEVKADREFDVMINDQSVLENFGSKNYLEPEKALNFKIIANTNDDKGLHVKFVSKKGKNILNAVEVKKIF